MVNVFLLDRQLSGFFLFLGQFVMRYDVFRCGAVEAVHVHVFLESGFGGRPKGQRWDIFSWILYKSNFLLLVCRTLPTPALIRCD